VIGGNRFAYNRRGGVGPYAAYSSPHFAAGQAPAPQAAIAPKAATPAPAESDHAAAAGGRA